MDWQLVASFGLLAAAVGYLAWKGVKMWRTSQQAGCPGGCGCAKSPAPATPALIPAESLVLRPRERAG